MQKKRKLFSIIDSVGPSCRVLGSLIDYKLLMHVADAAIVKRARPKVRIHLRGQRFHSIANMMMFCSRHMYGASLSLRPQQSTMLQRQLCHPLTASKKHLSDQLALIYCHEAHLYDKKRCALSFLKDMLCVLQFKNKHAVQIVVAQNMTLHCS